MPADQPTFESMFGHPKETTQSSSPLPSVGRLSASGGRELLEDEFRPHYESWKAEPSPANAGKVLKALDPVIKSALRTYAGGGQASPTIRSRAKMIVLDSLPRYDPAKAKLRTHLMVNLQSLRRSSAEENQIVAVPERVRLDQHRLYTASNELADQLGREPSDAELAAHTGLSIKRLGHIRKAKTGYSEGQTQGALNADGEGSSLAAPAVSSGDNSVWLDFIYGDLQPTDQFIMERTLGLNGHRPMLKGDIAKKLGISAGAVSQRAARIQKMIDLREDMQHPMF